MLATLPFSHFRTREILTELMIPMQSRSSFSWPMEHGAEKLLALLKRHGVYPFTEVERDSVPLNG